MTMKILVSSTLLALSGAGLGGCAMMCSPAHMESEARALDGRFAESFAKGDLDGVMATYWNSPDLVFYPPDVMELHGPAAVRQNYAEAFKNMPGAKLQL